MEMYRDIVRDMGVDQIRINDIPGIHIHQYSKTEKITLE